MISRVIIIFLMCLTISPLDAQLGTNRRDAIIPYLMKSDHPLKSHLDKFFSEFRAIHSQETLAAAGFINIRKRLNILCVVKHPSFPGYVFKTFLDADPPFHNQYEEINWIRRIQGVRKIRKEIDKQGLNAQFKTPQKWIYELPEFPKPNPDFYPKYTLVVEEDMDVLPRQENHKMWGSKQLSTEILDGFQSIIQAVGLRDIKPANQPFCKDGSIAFIDTTSINQVPLYDKLTRYLSPKNQKYWKSISKKKKKEPEQSGS